MHSVVTKEQYATVKQVEQVFLGTPRCVLRKSISDVFSVGLINFLGGKEAKLQAVVRHVDISAHDFLQPLNFLVEFMSFISGGLMVEAEKIEEATRDMRKAVVAFTHEMQRCEVELRHRQKCAGTNVTRALAQFYNTKRPVPSIAAAGGRQQEGYSQELVQTIAEDRARLREAKKQLKALVMVQRLLWGAGNVSRDAVEHLLGNFSVTMAVYKFNHKLRDIIFSVKGETRNLHGCLASLEEFIANVAVGLSAATEDLDTCVVSLKKCILMQEEYARVCCIDAGHKKFSADISLTPHVPHLVGRGSAAATETEELSKLYCS